MVEEIPISESLLYNKNNKGSRMEPWVKTKITCEGVLEAPSEITRCCLLVLTLIELNKGHSFNTILLKFVDKGFIGVSPTSIVSSKKIEIF